jgi:hypothetical protein
MAMLLTDGLYLSTCLHDGDTRGKGVRRRASCVDNREAGIAFPIEMSFIPTKQVLQIILVRVLRD